MMIIHVAAISFEQKEKATPWTVDEADANSAEDCQPELAVREADARA
jgi:hypothetical protein